MAVVSRPDLLESQGLSTRGRSLREQLSCELLHGRNGLPLRVARRCGAQRRLPGKGCSAVPDKDRKCFGRW